MFPSGLPGPHSLELGQALYPFVVSIPWTHPKHDRKMRWIFRMEVTNSVARLASSLSFVYTIYSFFKIDLHEGKGREKQAWLSSHPEIEDSRRAPCCWDACPAGQNLGHRGLELVGQGWQLRAHCSGLCH